MKTSFCAIACLAGTLVLLRPVKAAELVVLLSNGQDVTFVGAVDRWDEDGNPRRAVDPKAKVQMPDVDQVAKKTGDGSWTFSQLPAGRYDLVILARDRVRYEGFGYPPVLEFDPFIRHEEQASEASCDFITKDIAKSRLYENKVEPLFFAGGDKTVRVFVQLLRDKPTSFDAEFGEPVATLRHEVWQYSNRYGAWSKEKRTRVFDRVLMAKRELRTWTWLWDPKLGGIEVADEPVVVQYALPKPSKEAAARGLLPY
jgi:hypothetical protein